MRFPLRLPPSMLQSAQTAAGTPDVHHDTLLDGAGGSKGAAKRVAPYAAHCLRHETHPLHLCEKPTPVCSSLSGRLPPSLSPGELVVDKDPGTGAHRLRFLAYDIVALQGQQVGSKPFSERYEARRAVRRSPCEATSASQEILTRAFQSLCVFVADDK